MNMTPWTLSADVLIVGGGFTGMWAAKKARDHVRDVLIVDKGPTRQHVRRRHDRAYAGRRS